MLNRLTKRERFLAMVVGSMLPFLLVFGFLYWAYTSYNDNKMQIRSLRDQLNDEDFKVQEMDLAGKRKEMYRNFSLPADIDLAKTQYRSYLSNLGEQFLGVEVFPLKPMRDLEKKYKNQEKIFDQIAFQSSGCVTTYEELVNFLYEFHRTKLTQRIREISIRPLNDAKGKRLNSIKVDMTFEAIALVDAEVKRDFQSERLDYLTKELQDYKDSIVYRNVFGGPNVQPVFKTTRAPDLVDGDQVRFKIDVEDENENQKLTYELVDVDSTMPNAKLTKGFTDRSVNFDAGVLPIGRYQFTVIVRDNGCPVKESRQKFVARVEKKPKQEKKKDDTPPPPKFQHSKATYITALLRGIDGQAVVWIDTRTLSEVPLYILKVGDTFKLDGSKWLVKTIDPDGDIVTLTRDNHDYSYKNGDTLFVKEMMARKDAPSDTLKPTSRDVDDDETNDNKAVETKSDDSKSDDDN